MVISYNVSLTPMSTAYVNFGTVSVLNKWKGIIHLSGKPYFGHRNFQEYQGIYAKILNAPCCMEMDVCVLLQTAFTSKRLALIQEMFGSRWLIMRQTFARIGFDPF